MSCATSKIIIDYDAKIDFSNFKSYAFFEDLGKGLNELDVKRLIKVMNSELQQVGFLQSDNPDFLSI
jgi:hypothetical protein